MAQFKIVKKRPQPGLSKEKPQDKLRTQSLYKKAQCSSQQNNRINRKNQQKDHKAQKEPNE